MASNTHVEGVLAAFPKNKPTDAASAFLSKISKGSTAEDLKALNDHFLPIVYFQGNEFTTDDLHLFVALHPVLSRFNDADRVASTNITRWFDHVQHISGVSTKVSLPVVAINQNAAAVIAAAKKQKPSAAPATTEEKKEEVKAAPPAAEDKKPHDAKGKDDKQKEKQEQILKAKQERAQLAKEKAAQMPKQERAPKAPKAGQPQQGGGAKKGGADADERSDIEHLDVRVGKILNVKRHPDADALYVEEIDLGEGKPRTIVSGLVKFVPIEELQDRIVLVLANLKPRPLKGIASHGMVLCVSNEDKSKVEPLLVPEGVAVGERVFFGATPSPHAADVELNPKKKFFEKVQPDWKTNDDKIAVYKDLVWNTSKGPITTASITKGTIS